METRMSKTRRNSAHHKEPLLVEKCCWNFQHLSSHLCQAPVEPVKEKRPRRLLALQYNYSDSEDEETREERKARIVSDQLVALIFCHLFDGA